MNRMSYTISYITSIKNSQGTVGVATTVMNYSYDQVGNLLSMTDSINGTTGVNNAGQYDAL